ncbi:MAG TPA: F0F1 ATP synthase subunit B [Ignavibacteria bacterium]|nr:F0F1 ATP synthase subunit B [Ignavibacteria bacterium]
MLSFAYSTLIFLLSEPVHEKPSLLTVNPGLIIWTIVIFILLLLVLKKFAWKPLIKALNSREDTIKSALENAEKQNQLAAEIIEKNKQQLSEANAESMKIINAGRETASKIKDEIISKANEEYTKIVNQAKEEIERQKTASIDEIKNEIVDMSMKIAEQVIRKNLNAETQKQIVNDFITKIPKN